MSDKHSVAVSANAACSDAVSSNPSGIKEDYENLGMVLKSVDDRSISDTEKDFESKKIHVNEKGNIKQEEIQVNEQHSIIKEVFSSEVSSL